MAFLVFRGCIYFLSARAEFGVARIRLRARLKRALFAHGVLRGLDGDVPSELWKTECPSVRRGARLAYARWTCIFLSVVCMMRGSG